MPKPTKKVNRNLSQIADNQIWLFRRFGRADEAKLSERLSKLQDTPNWENIFHEARISKYLGTEQPLFHSRKRIERTIENLEIGQKVVNGYSEKIGDYDFYCSPTHSTEKLPAAAWAFRISKNGKIIGRIGVNFHLENGNIIASIPNIQGKAREELDLFSETVDEKWAVHLTRKVVELLKPKVHLIRGIRARYHSSRKREGFELSSAMGLYDATFRELGFDRKKTYCELEGALA